MAHSPLLVVAAVALLAALAGVHSQVHTKVETLADSCEQQVRLILDARTSGDHLGA